MYIEILGMFGALLLIAAWIPELINIFKNGKSKMDNTFTEIMFLATLTLLIYSFLIYNKVFIIINSFLLFQISVSIYYSVFK